MKKALAILLALALVGGVAFAQVTVSGRVQGTSTFEMDAADEFAMTFAPLVRINISGKTEDGNTGASIRMNLSNITQAVAGTNDPITEALFSYAYGYVKLLDGMITLNAGKLYHFDYSTFNNSASEMYGMFDAGSLFWTLQNYGIYANIAATETLSFGVKIIPDAALSLGDFGVAVGFDIPDTAHIVLTSTLNDTVADSEIDLAISISAVENLYAVVGYAGLTAHKAYAIVGYNVMENFYVEANTIVTLSPAIDYYAELIAEYGFAPNFRAGFDFVYYNGGNMDIFAELNYSANKFYFTTGLQLNVAAGAVGWSVPVVLRYNF